MQSRWMSLIESGTYTLIGILLSSAANYLVLPLIWHLNPSPVDSLAMAVFFAVLSFAKNYPIRRVFNAIRCEPASSLTQTSVGQQGPGDSRKVLAGAEFARVLCNRDGATLSVCADGKQQHWPMSKRSVCVLLSSAAEAVSKLD